MWKIGIFHNYSYRDNSRKQRKRRKRDVIISNELVFRCDKNSKQKRVEYPQKQTDNCKMAYLMLINR